MVVNEEHPRAAPAPRAGTWRAHVRLGWRSPAVLGIVRDTSVPSPPDAADGRGTAAARHPGVDGLGQPLPVTGHLLRIESLPAVAHEQ